MESFTIKVDTTTGERTVDPLIPSEGKICDLSYDSFGNIKESPSKHKEIAASEPSRVPIVLRRGGSRPNLPGRKSVPKPNSDQLQSVSNSPSKCNDLRKEISHADLRSELSRHRIQSTDESDLIVLEEYNADGLDDDAEGIEVEGEDFESDSEEDLRMRIRRSPVRGTKPHPTGSCSNAGGNELEDDRLSLTADDDDLGLDFGSRTLEKNQGSSSNAVKSERNVRATPSSKSTSSPVAAKSSSKSNGKDIQSKSLEKSSIGTPLQAVKQPPAKPLSNSGNPIRISDKVTGSNLKQPPAKPDQTASKPLDPSSVYTKPRPPPPKVDVKNRPGSSAPVSSSNVSGKSPSESKPAERKSDVPSGSVNKTAAQANESKLCQSCSATQSLDAKLSSLIKVIHYRPRKKDDLDVMSQKEFQDISNNITDIARRARESKCFNVLALALNAVMASGRLDENMLTELLPKVIVAGKMKLKDFQLHVRPMIEHYCRILSDTSLSLQNLLGIYWYFGDWEGLWDIVMKLIYKPESSKSIAFKPTRNLPIVIVKGLLRLVVNNSNDRVGIVAWLISNLPRKDVTSNFKPALLLKMIPLLEKRNLLRFRVKMEDLTGTQPPDLKSKAINDKMCSLGRRLQSFTTKKQQTTGNTIEAPFLVPCAEDVIADVCFLLRGISANEDLVVEAFSSFLSFFTARSTSDCPELKRYFSSVVFYMARFGKSKFTVMRLIGKLEKVGVDFTQQLSDEVLLCLPNDLKVADVSLKIADAIIADFKDLPDIKSKHFGWITGPSFIPLSKISNTEELSAVVRQKSNFFNSLLSKIPDSPISAQHGDYFNCLVKAYLLDTGIGSNFKDEYKLMYNFDKSFEKLCVSCIKTQRTAMLSELYHHLSCPALFPRSGGQPNELIFRLFIVALALRDDRAKSVAAYRMACSASIFPVQPESTIDGHVVIKIPSFFTEPEILTLIISVLDQTYKLYQEGSFSPTTLPSFALKVETVKPAMSVEGISLLSCSSSEDPAISRIRAAAATTLGLHFDRLNSGLLKIPQKDTLSMFGSWKTARNHPSLPKFDPTSDKLMALAREAGAFKPVFATSSNFMVESRSFAANSGSAKRPAPSAFSKDEPPAKSPSIPPLFRSAKEDFKIPKRSHPDDDYRELSPRKASRPLSTNNGDSSHKLTDRNGAKNGSSDYRGRESYPSTSASREQDRRQLVRNFGSRDQRGDFPPADESASVADDPYRTTEKLLRRVGQYLQDKELEHQSDAVINFPPPSGFIQSSNEPSSRNQSSMPSVQTKLVEAATSAVFAAVRDAAGAPNSNLNETAISRAWDEFEERRACANVYGGSTYSSSANQHQPSLYPPAGSNPPDSYGEKYVSPSSFGPYGGLEQRSNTMPSADPNDSLYPPPPPPPPIGGYQPSSGAGVYPPPPPLPVPSSAQRANISKGQHAPPPPPPPPSSSVDPYSQPYYQNDQHRQSHGLRYPLPPGLLGPSASHSSQQQQRSQYPPQLKPSTGPPRPNGGNQRHAPNSSNPYDQVPMQQSHLPSYPRPPAPNSTSQQPPAHARPPPPNSGVSQQSNMQPYQGYQGALDSSTVQQYTTAASAQLPSLPYAAPPSQYPPLLPQPPNNGNVPPWHGMHPSWRS